MHHCNCLIIPPDRYPWQNQRYCNPLIESCLGSVPSVMIGLLQEKNKKTKKIDFLRAIK